MLHNHFSTPIYCKHFTRFESESMQKEIGSIIDELDFDKVPEWGPSNHSISDPTFRSTLFGTYNMPNTVNKILSTVKEYIKSLDCEKQFITDIKESWLTDTRKNEHTVPHNHGAFDISGVYYYATNSKDGDLHFVNPSPITDTSKYVTNTQYIKYMPQVGLMLLFPSWLTHFVNENETDNRRISLSFNIELTEK